MDDRQKRRIFQWVKSLSTERFWSWMNWLHSRAYAAAVRHYTEAAEIVLPPRLQKQLHAKAAEIRELWDGMKTITLDETEAEDFDKVLGRRETE
jgi:hypothetical protein